MDNFASTLRAMSWTFNLIFMHIRLHVNYWREKLLEKLKVFYCESNRKQKKEKHNKIHRIQRNKMMEDLITPLFGSQLVNSSSKTPYSDATQVRGIKTFFASQLFVSLPSQPSSSSRSALNFIEKDFIPFYTVSASALLVQHIERRASEERREKVDSFGVHISDVEIRDEC